MAGNAVFLYKYNNIVIMHAIVVMFALLPQRIHLGNASTYRLFQNECTVQATPPCI